MLRVGKGCFSIRCADTRCVAVLQRKGRGVSPKNRTVLGALGLAFGVFAANIAAAQAAEKTQLERRLDSALASRALKGARIAALVVSQDDGRVLYRRDAQRMLVPASNQKILTSLAVFRAFGPTFRFVTQIFADRVPDAEGSVEFLALKGSGDPGLTSEDFWRLAADLRREGLRRVTGGILLDDSAFDAVRWHPSWKTVSARAYHAPVGALTANYGTFAVAVAPGATEGAPVAVSIDPVVPLLRPVNRATTSAAGTRRSLVVDRRSASGHLDIVVSGRTAARGDQKIYYRSVVDPALLAGAVFQMQLEANGITVEGEPRRAVIPPAARLLHEHRGKSLAELVRLFMKYSNNAMGESLVKSLGARVSGGIGSWENGVPALRAELASAGLDVESIHIVDGSGLSYDNRVSPTSLVAALRVAADSFQFGPEFAAALPVPGGSGTLEERAALAGQRVRAKTGLLTRVTALSGYAETRDGSRAIFSVIVNGFRGSADRAMSALDGFVAALVGPDSS